MKGFFKAITKTKVKKNPSSFVKTCADCPLKDQECNGSEVFISGEGKKRILILTGTLNLQKANVKRLESELKRVGINLNRDCSVTSVIQAKKPYQIEKINNEEKEVTISEVYVDCCRSKIDKFIREYRPKAILALGDRVMTSLVRKRSTFRGAFPNIDGWEGACIPDQEYCTWIIPTWSIPRLLEFEEKDNGSIYTRHFRESIKMLAEKENSDFLEKRDDVSFCLPILEDDEAINKIEECRRYCYADKKAAVAFDYETTGLRPYAKGQKLICVSMCWKNDLSISFMLTKKVIPVFDSLLQDKNVKKISHNLSFEELWSLEKMPAKVGVKGWKQDTQLDAHILDNRTGITGLKYQTYIHFGVAGYDDDADPYIGTADKKTNSINRMEELSPKKILTYCALDSLYTKCLSDIQNKKFDELSKKYPEVISARKLFLEGAIALTEMTHNGFRIDMKQLKENKEEILKLSEKCISEVMQDPEVKKWRKREGIKFNLNSPQQLAKTLYDQMGLSCEKTTKSGGRSTDAKTVSDLEVPFIEKQLESKKLKKIISTYLSSYEDEQVNGILRSGFPLNGVRSFRGSSNNPNVGL